LIDAECHNMPPMRRLCQRACDAACFYIARRSISGCRQRPPRERAVSRQSALAFFAETPRLTPPPRPRRPNQRHVHYATTPALD